MKRKAEKQRKLGSRGNHPRDLYVCLRHSAGICGKTVCGCEADVVLRRLWSRTGSANGRGRRQRGREKKRQREPGVIIL